MSYQKLLLIGHLGSDPSMKYTPAGKAVTSFSLAVNTGYGEQKQTQWFRVSAWEKLAENCNNFLKKGSKCLVEGRLVADPETGGPRVFTRNDGTTGASFEVSASTVQFLDSRTDNQPEEDEPVPF